MANAAIFPLCHFLSHLDHLIRNRQDILTEIRSFVQYYYTRITRASFTYGCVV
jgi:hypothetical protein